MNKSRTLDAIAAGIAIAGIMLTVVVMTSAVCWAAWSLLQALQSGIDVVTMMQWLGGIGVTALFLWALDRTARRELE